MNHLQTDCRKRKRAGGAGDHEQSNILGMQEVPLPNWIDLNSSHPSPLPPGWEQCLDLQSGNMYFVNAATQTRVLEDPRGILLKEQSMIGKGESLGLDLEMRLPSLANMHTKVGIPGLPSMFFEDIPNHYNSFHSNSNYGISATNPTVLKSPFSTNSTMATTHSISSMAATVCIHCHTFVMVSRESPHCPNCKNVCSRDPSIRS